MKKKHIFEVIMTFLLSLVLSGCVHSDGPYKGKVVELETGEPIEGAVVAAKWAILTFAHTERICAVTETVTGKNGKFELPKVSCTSHPFAELNKPRVVVFKPGYLAYPPLGYNPEERKEYMPDFTGDEFRNINQQYIIKLGRPKTRQEKESTLHRAETLFIENEFLKKLPNLLRETNRESKSLGLGERPIR